MDSALNLPFSEWPTKIPNARLCKAMLDRLTDRAHIIASAIGRRRQEADLGNDDL